MDIIALTDRIMGKKKLSSDDMYKVLWLEFTVLQEHINANTIPTVRFTICDPVTEIDNPYDSDRCMMYARNVRLIPTDEEDDSDDGTDWENEYNEGEQIGTARMRVLNGTTYDQDRASARTYLSRNEFVRDMCHILPAKTTFYDIVPGREYPSRTALPNFCIRVIDPPLHILHAVLEAELELVQSIYGCNNAIHVRNDIDLRETNVYYVDDCGERYVRSEMGMPVKQQ